MITKVADLMGQFLEIERERLNSEKITHRPTIGGMYEELSRHVLDRTIPCDGLAVGSGFIEDEDGKQSAELDCLLVKGEGRALPYSDKRIYAPDDVIAVVQVKKKLYSKDIADGFENLRSVMTLKTPRGKNVVTTARRSFQLITKTPWPSDPEKLPPLLFQMYHTLIVEAARPVRILLGYYGFKSATRFREGLSTHIESLESEQGWHPAMLPNFIIGPNASAMKNTAMPFGGTMVNGWWPLIATNDSMPSSLLFLEAIWTRLNHMGLVDAAVFGEDLQSEEWERLLDARLLNDTSWQYYSWPAKHEESKAERKLVDWSPTFVSMPAFQLVAMLCRRGRDPLDVTDLMMLPEVEEAVRELESTGLVAKDPVNTHHLYLLTDGMAGGIMPDGRFAIGENNSGRLVRWLAKHYGRSEEDIRRILGEIATEAGRIPGPEPT
jgi:hypothetical protein